MIKISHRGNYAGRNAARENDPAYILEAIHAGYDVEVDVWLLDREWYLGHDFPKYHIPVSWLENNRLWVHAKNLEGYVSLWRNPKVNVFWHNKDDFVFTSMGIKWANTGVITHDGIMVMPELTPGTIEELRLERIVPLGICTDDFSVLRC